MKAKIIGKMYVCKISQAVIRRAKERFEEKSEGGDWTAQSQDWLPQQDS